MHTMNTKDDNINVELENAIAQQATILLTDADGQKVNAIVSALSEGMDKCSKDATPNLGDCLVAFATFMAGNFYAAANEITERAGKPEQLCLEACTISLVFAELLQGAMAVISDKQP